MYLVLITLRLVHIVSGVLWVGMMAFTAFFLTPAIREAGPMGGKVMAGLQRRGMMMIMPLVALATIFSGALLMWRLSGGSLLGLLQTPVGLTFAAGGAAALVAFGVGMAILRPTNSRVGALMTSASTATNEEERMVRGAEIQRLRARAEFVTRVVALLLIVAAGAMAVARYV